MKNMNNYALEISRSEEFTKIAEELSQYIIKLGLPVTQNDQLIALIIKQINEAERTQFMKGLEFGIKLIKDNGEFLEPIKKDS